MKQKAASLLYGALGIVGEQSQRVNAGVTFPDSTGIWRVELVLGKKGGP